MSLREAAEKALNWIEWRDANIHEWFREGISVNETLRNALAEAEKDESAEAVTAERDALRQDAERYRYIRDNHETRGRAMEIVYGLNGTDWDAAIDAALAKEAK